MAKVLILGGTTEARALGESLAKRGGMEVMLSLAGRTAAPVKHAVPVRVGGFGGSGGLADYLLREKVDAFIDATHPYASVISRNAAAAARRVVIPLVVLRRPPWIAIAGDRWTEVSDVSEAVRALGETSRRVFVTIGRNGLAAFSQAPQHHYLIRSVDPVDPPLPLPHVAYLTARGPFSEDEDRALMAAREIEIVIAKNSGGPAAYGKIAAARSLGIGVLMLRRPAAPEATTVATVEDAIAWLDHTLTSTAARGV